MRQSALERAVARATGESRRTIHRYGFQLVPDDGATELATHLQLDCPGCGAGVTLPCSGPLLPMFAECAACDTAYPYEPAEVYLPEVSPTVIAASA